jgi:Family of unknown function (DUF6461)
VIATASDYAWFEDRPRGLAETYRLTLARGRIPAEFLARIGARVEVTRVGVDALFEPSMHLWDEYPYKGTLIGVTAAPGDDGDWAVAVEVNGYLGITEEAMIPLSAGTRVVSHYYSGGNGVARFYWFEDGVIRLYFDPVEPAYREGTTPDAVLDVMREVGFDMGEEGDNAEDSTGAALALADYLTGVRLTPELLEDSIYTCGIAPVPPI